MEQSVKERIMSFINYKRLSQRKFERLVGFSNGYLDKLRHAPSVEKTQIIIDTFPELNRIWLLTGEGEMLNGDRRKVDEANRRVLDWVFHGKKMTHVNEKARWASLPAAPPFH